MPPVSFRRHVPGSSKRLKKKKDEEMVQSQSGSLLKFVTVTKSGPSKIDVVVEEEIKEKEAETHFSEKSQKTVPMHIDEVDENENMEENEDKSFQDINDRHKTVDMNDPGNWGRIEKGVIDFLVEKGPPPRLPIDYHFPRDHIGRCFSHSSYTRKMTNWEKHDRRRLVYSKSKDLFCFCCKLLSREADQCRPECRNGLKQFKKMWPCISVTKDTK